MFCTNCGKILKGDERFCSNCGTPVENNNQASRFKNKNIDVYEVFFNEWIEDKRYTIYIHNRFGNNKSGVVDLSFPNLNNIYKEIKVNFMLEPDEKIYFFYDNTFFGSAKKGFLISNKAVYINSGNIYKKIDFYSFISVNISYDKENVYVARIPFSDKPNEIEVVYNMAYRFQKRLMGYYS